MAKNQRPAGLPDSSGGWRCGGPFGVVLWKILARDTLGKQLVRCADSIGANIAGGSGRGSVLDNRRFVRMPRGSLYEAKHWLGRACKRSLLTSEQTDSLRQTIDELTRTLNGYLRSLKPQSWEVTVQDPRIGGQDPRSDCLTSFVLRAVGASRVYTLSGRI